MKEFKSLSRHDRKERLRNVKAELAAQKAAKQSGAEPSTNTLLLVILALLLPPLAVYLHQGEINTKFWISLLLTLVFFLPGVIYALVVVLGEA
ncbi:YqaE/Pmp3 family membrane protein [Segetibacter sp. 3557_3]|nr:YqaE/Pmp3 family membrane protein [Segetibacter sp. 3557_3]